MTLAVAGVDEGWIWLSALSPYFEIYPFLVGTILKERQICIESVALVSK
jgi:hypothetical protein